MTRNASVEEQMRVLMRGVEYGDPNIQRTMEEELRARLAEGRLLRVYAGFDPTAVDLHLGHIVPMMKLRQFQEFGHEVTFLIGTMTAVIGDPTDRSASRQMQTPEQVEANARTWLGQAFRILDSDKTVVKRNGDWLAPLNLTDFVRLAANFTVQQFLDHDTFRRRIEAQRPVYLHEFVYALMQGYDAVAMNTDVQIGGTEQLFNIMAGRTLQRAFDQKPQVAICLPILLGTDGTLRMSKSTGNYIGLDEPPAEMYGKVMSVPDTLIGNYFTLLTDVPNDEIASIERAVAEHRNSMDAKKRLAREIVALLHGEAAADAAQEEFERVFQRREQPEKTIEIAFTNLPFKDLPFVDVTLIAGPVPHGFSPSVKLATLLSQVLHVSVSAARRLIDEGAVQVNGAVTKSAFPHLKHGDLIRAGRHTFIRVVA